MPVYNKNNCIIIVKHEIDQWSRMSIHSKGKRIYIMFQPIIIPDFPEIFLLDL